MSTFARNIPRLVSQNDPDEPLETYDSRGQPTGTAKSRAAIHLDGDWHRAFHCWIVRRHGSEIVLQRRSLVKDTFAGYWDAAAAGHWRFGESGAEAAREITEELGIHVPFNALAYRGQERASRRFANGLIDREFHQVYVLHSDRPLSAYRPDPDEVIGLAAFPAKALVELAAGRRAEVAASEAVSVEAGGALVPAEVVVSRDGIVPYSAARLRRIFGRTRAH